MGERTRYKGTVTRYDRDEGNGYITTSQLNDDMGDTDILFHKSYCSVNNIKEGVKVTFIIEKNEKGHRKVIILATDNSLQKSEEAKAHRRQKKGYTGLNKQSRPHLKSNQDKNEEDKDGNTDNKSSNPFKNDTGDKNDLLGGKQ